MYFFGVAVEEVLADRVRLVVLIDTDPAHERVPHDRVDPCVLQRGGGEAGWVPAEGLERRVDEDDSESEAQVHDRLGLCLVERLHRSVDVLSRLGDRDFRDDPNAFAPTGTSQVLQVALADEALLDQDTDLGESPFGDEVGQEDRLIGHGSLGECERPLA